MLNSINNHSTFRPFDLSTKKGFTIIEVTVVFLLILCVTFLVLPHSLNNTKHARLISRWATKYSELEYMYSVIKAQPDGQYSQELAKTRENIPNNCTIPDIFKPYLRITSELISKNYSQRYMNSVPVTPKDKQYFSKFYKTSSNEIVSLKWLSEKCEGEKICAIMAFDLNGESEPNTWGYDIFGLDLYKDKMEVFGKKASPEILKTDCSKSGSGVTCSYYYLMGGRFD